jgi:hypothetical protein
MAITNKETGEVEYVGCVLNTYLDVYRVMSDVWCDAQFAQVWSDEQQRVMNVVVKLYFDQSTDRAAEVDATPETLHKVEEYNAAIAEASRVRDEAYRKERELAARNAAVKGKRMRVVRGRKVRVGTIGTVFFIRDDRVGLDVTGLKNSRGYVIDPVWVDSRYLEVAETDVSGV